MRYVGIVRRHWAMFDDPTPEQIAATEAAAAAEAAKNAGKVPEGHVSQAKVNELLAAERRSAQTKLQAQVEALEQLKAKATLTDQERNGLTTQIETLQGMYQTAEERAKNALDKANKESAEKLKTLEGEAKIWRNRFDAAEIGRAINDAAGEFKAVHASQIAAILKPNTKMTEVPDETGKPTGNYAPMVDFEHLDNDGKPVMLKVSVGEAVKLMKERDIYSNLFIDERSGGAGARGTSKGAGSVNGGKVTYKELGEMTADQFIEYTTKNKEAMKSLASQRN